MQDFSSYLQVHSSPFRCPFRSVPVSIPVHAGVHSGPFRCQFRSIPASISVHSSVHSGPFWCPFHCLFHCPFGSVSVSIPVRSGPFLYFHAPQFAYRPCSNRVFSKVFNVFSKCKALAEPK